jgi:hypothetical protein
MTYQPTSRAFVIPVAGASDRPGDRGVATQHAATKPRSTIINLIPKKLGTLGYFLGPLVLVVVWEFASAVGWLSPRQLAAPSTAIVTGYEMLVDGVLLDHSSPLQPVPISASGSAWFWRWHQASPGSAKMRSTRWFK